MIRYIFILALFSFVGCKTKNDEVKSKKFDRYVFALTFNNNAKNKLDSLEKTNTICHTLIYLTKDNYCEMLFQQSNELHFFKGFAEKKYADSLISTIENLNDKYSKTFNPDMSCVPDVNIILEKDTTSIYKFISYGEKGIFDFVARFEIKNKLKQTDSIDNVIKYKYYIINKASNFIKSYYYDSIPIRR